MSEMTYPGTDRSYFDGAFWQPIDGPTPDFRRRLLPVRAAQGVLEVANTTINVYQGWVELDWREPHGSEAMQERLSRKLGEEACQEVLVELARVQKWYGVPRKHPDMLGELADVAWPVTAQESQHRHRLSEDLVARLQSQDVQSPPAEELTIGHIDELMSLGFKPLILVKQSMLPYEVRTFDNMDPEVIWPTLALAMRGLADVAAARAEIKPVLHEKLGRTSADCFLYCAYMARRWGGGTLAEAIRSHVLKITNRVETNTIDASDGPRTGEVGVQ